MPAGSPIDQWWKSHLPPKAPRPDTAQEVHCPECGQRLGSSSDAGAARRLVSWHRDHCTAALDIFATQESGDPTHGCYARNGLGHACVLPAGHSEGDDDMSRHQFQKPADPVHPPMPVGHIRACGCPECVAWLEAHEPAERCSMCRDGVSHSARCHHDEHEVCDRVAEGTDAPKSCACPCHSPGDPS